MSAIISRVFGACRTLMAKAAATPAATVAETGKEGKRLLKTRPISQPLARFAGESKLSRPDALKKVREYVKIHKLQNPANKKEIQCDDKLKMLFDGKEKVGFTEISKLLFPHFIKPEKNKSSGPDCWTDYRRKKLDGTLRPTHPDYKKKDGSIALWVTPNLSMDFNFEIDYWSDLVDKPEQWIDYRLSRQNRSVPLRHPSFRKKDGTVALWLEKAPKEILPTLEGVKFNVPVKGEAGEASGEAKDQQTMDPWEDLLENSDDWLDCRETKGRRRHPDFRKKDGDVTLWLENAPSGFLAKLKDVKFDVPVGAKGARQRKANRQERINNWWSLLNKPEEWRDYRESKQNGSVHPKHPDFKRKPTGESLWLDQCPSSVLKKLPPP